MTDQQNHIFRSTSIYEVFFKQASAGILLSDSKGTIITANPYLSSLFGYKENELTGKTIETLIPERFQSNHVHHRSHYLENPQPRPMGIGMELFGRKKDGTEFPVEVSLSTIKDNDETFVFAIVADNSVRIADKNKIFGLQQDLESTVDNRTRELTRTLEVVELLNDKHEVALANQKAILDNAKVMLYATDEKGIIQFFNPEATRLTGYRDTEVVRKETPLLFHRALEIDICRKELFTNYQIETIDDFEVIKQKSLLGHISNMECYFVNKDKVEVPVSLTVSPIKDKKNKLIGFMGVALDITERKKAEMNLMEALEKEKKLGEMKSRFVSMASHEFRTPLSTILSSAYLIEKYTECDEQHKREKHISRIVSAVNNLTNILNEFLSVGKIEEGKLVLHVSDFNLKKLSENIVADMKNMLKNGQHISYVHSGNEDVYSDGTLMKNIIINLLSNAIKFSDAGSEIVFNTRCEENLCIVQVKDNGIGISDEDQKHLMERFFRGANAENVQGTGLGLHIVSKYVERLYGSISCESELNKGTCFTISFDQARLKSQGIENQTLQHNTI